MQAVYTRIMTNRATKFGDTLRFAQLKSSKFLAAVDTIIAMTAK